MTISAAAAVLREHYNLTCSVSPLPGEIDLNFRATCTADNQYVFKVAAPERSRAELDLQIALLQHLEQQDLSVAIPQVLTSTSGQTICASECNRLVHVLTWVAGRPLREVGYRSQELLTQWGQLCAQLSLALANFDHPAAHRNFRWCPSQTLSSTTLLHYLTDPQQRALVEQGLTIFRAHVAPLLPQLPKQVNYNDAHEDNLLVDADPLHPQLIGLIDVGDAVVGPTVCELAIAAAYAGMDCPDPLSQICILTKAYHSLRPLTEPEVQALYGLIIGRLVISVLAAAEARHCQPNNSYRTASEQQAWQLLPKLLAHPYAFAHYSLRAACGYTAHPQEADFQRWALEQTFAPVLHLEARQLRPLKLSVDSNDLGHYLNYTELDRFCSRMQVLCTAGVGYGGYLETRPFYTTDLFAQSGNDGPRWRTVHLGLDLWCPAGQPVYAPFAGTVHSFRQNNAPRDYGATLVLEHEVSTHLRFYTLYGHLSAKSLDGKTVGATVAAGEQIATTGTPAENGGWPPHLHFQVMLDMLNNKGDFPGVAFPTEVEVWAGTCPNPTLICGLPLEAKLVSDHSQLLARRQHVLGQSYSLSYQQPLHIGRGHGTYLLDHTGRRYLDMVNNVAHVGHEHPRVVEAIQQQAAVLNTNTRYLHEAVIAFAEELTATLPPQLCVVYVVNSGSEANELALRMARAATGHHDVLAVEHGYHGNTSATIGISSYKFDGRGGEGAPPGTHIVPVPDVFRGAHRDANLAGEAYAVYLDTAIATAQQQGGGVAAFICESIMSCAGQVVLPKGYLFSAYAKTRAAGGVCIADEVQVGVGRVGTHFWGFELQGVVPDIITIGKPIGNGHPLGAVVSTRAVADAFAATGMEYFNTFGGNPVSAAAGRAVLRVVREEDLQQQARELGDYLLAELHELQHEYPLIGDVRGHGLFIGIELVKNEETLTPAALEASYLVNRMRTRGVLLSTDGPHHNVIKLKPPLCITNSQAAAMLAELRQVLRESLQTNRQPGYA